MTSFSVSNVRTTLTNNDVVNLVQSYANELSPEYKETLGELKTSLKLFINLSKYAFRTAYLTVKLVYGLITMLYSDVKAFVCSEELHAVIDTNKQSAIRIYQSSKTRAIQVYETYEQWSTKTNTQVSKYVDGVVQAYAFVSKHVQSTYSFITTAICTGINEYLLGE